MTSKTRVTDLRGEHMGIIKKELMVAGSKSSRRCEVLMDFYIPGQSRFQQKHGILFEHLKSSYQNSQE